MGTVVQLNRGGPRPDPAVARASRAEAADRAKRAMLMAGMGALGVLRYAVFLVLLFLRRPVRFVLNLAATGGFLALVLMALGMHGPDKARMLWITGGMTFACVSLAWFYDTLVLRLSPQPLILT